MILFSSWQTDSCLISVTCGSDAFLFDNLNYLYFKFTQKALGIVVKCQFLLSDLFWTLDINLRYTEKKDTTTVYLRLTKAWRKRLKGILFNHWPQSGAKLGLLRTFYRYGLMDISQPFQDPAAMHHYFQGWTFFPNILVQLVLIFAYHPLTVHIQEKSWLSSLYPLYSVPIRRLGLYLLWSSA